MKKTRVEKYAKHREEIASLDNEENAEEITALDVIEEKQQEQNIKQNTLSYSIEEIMKKHDEYTVMMDAAQVSEQKSIEEKRRRQERNRAIRNIAVYVLLGIIAVALIVVIILLLQSGGR